MAGVDRRFPFEFGRQPRRVDDQQHQSVLATEQEIGDAHNLRNRRAVDEALRFQARVEVQAGLTQATLELAGIGHGLLQPPHAFTSTVVCVSQPSFGLPLQSA